MALTLLIFAVICVALAFVDAHKILKGKWILHGVNAAVYIGMCVFAWVIFHNWVLIASLLFVRLLVFNIALSLFRGLKWDYVTPEDPAKAITDRVAKKIFGMNGKLMYAVYAVILIVLIVLTWSI